MIMERDCDDFGMVAPLFDEDKLSSIISRQSRTSSNESDRIVNGTRATSRNASNSEQGLISFSTQTDCAGLDPHSTLPRETNNNLFRSVPTGISGSSASEEIYAFKFQAERSNYRQDDGMKGQGDTTKLQEISSLPNTQLGSEDTGFSIRGMRRSMSSAGHGTEEKSYSDFRRCNSNILSNRKRKFVRRTTHLGGMELLKPRNDLENETTVDLAKLPGELNHDELLDTNLNMIENESPHWNNISSDAQNVINARSSSNYHCQPISERQFSDDSFASLLQDYSAISSESSVVSKRTATDQFSMTQMDTAIPFRARLVTLPRKDDLFLSQTPFYSNSQTFDRTQSWRLEGLESTENISFLKQHKESTSSSDSPPPLPYCPPPFTQDNLPESLFTPLTSSSKSKYQSELLEQIPSDAGYSQEVPSLMSPNTPLNISSSAYPTTSLNSSEHSSRQYPIKSISVESSQESKVETSSVVSSSDSSSTTSSEESSCEETSIDSSSGKSPLPLSDNTPTEPLNVKPSKLLGLQQSSANLMSSHIEYCSVPPSTVKFPNTTSCQTIPVFATNEVTKSILPECSFLMKNVLSGTEIFQVISSESASTNMLSPVNAEITKKHTALPPYSEFAVSSTESVMKSQFNQNIPVNTSPVDTTSPEMVEHTIPSLMSRRDHTHHLHLELNCANNNKTSSDQTIDFPPPIPPKSATIGKKDTSVNFPFHVTAERRGSSWNMDERDSPLDCPPILPPKRPCSYQNRRCCSTLIDSNSISINALPRSNSTEATTIIQVQSTSPSPVSSTECGASLVGTDVPPSLVEKNLTVVPPPRPPSMYRSFSHNEESIEKSALYILSSESGVKSEPPTISKKYGESLKSSAFIEARNLHVQMSKFSELFEQPFAKLAINTEARLQHFPVKLDSTHHRLFEVSPGCANLLRSPSSESKTNTFWYPDSGVFNRIYEYDDYQERRNSSDRPDHQDFDMCLSLDNSEAINEGMFVRNSETGSGEYSPRISKLSTTTRLSARFSREIPMYQRGGTIRPKKLSSESSDIELLRDEQEVGVDSSFDISQLGVADKNTQPTTKSKSKISLPHISKVSLQAVSDNLKSHFGKMSASNSTSVKKEHTEEIDQFQRSHSDRLQRKETEKANAPRNKSLSLGVPAFLRFSMTRDPSTVRGVPSDLNPLIDSAIQAIEEERHNILLDGSSDNLFTSSDRSRKPGRWDRRNSSSESDSLRFYNHQEARSSKSSGENTDPSSADNFSIVSFVSDQIDGRPDENTLAPLITRQESGIYSKESSDWNVEGINHSIKGLMKDMERYTEVLRDLHETYSIMRSKTPDGIRQRFDLAFKEIQIMIHLQNELNSVVAVSENDFGSIAEVFKKREFSVYKRYTVLANNIQKDMKSYATYFRENFTDLATKIMVPSTRLNVYAQHLRGFLNHFCSDSRHLLLGAITYLETLKDQANTEMTINVIQNCPVELRLLGLIRHVGEMHSEGDSLSRKLYYLILFDTILIITENKYDFFTYKQHIRSEQLMEVHEHGVARLILKVCPSYVNDVITYKFRTVTTKDRNTWISILKNWQDTNRPSYNNTVINQDLISQLNPKPERFWPLSLWLISPRLEEAVNFVKHQIITSAPPRRSNVDIFSEFVKLEEDFIEKLNILLDPESMPPPPILGSVLRKIRRFHKAQFLPKLKKAYANEPSSILDCIIGNLPNLPCLYKEFIEVRAGLTLTMIDGDNVRLYISPFQHLAAYIEWLYEVSCMPRYHSHLCGQLNILLNCVEDARVSLLHIAIPNCRMDYYKAGDILHRGSLESRVKSKNVKNNQNYYVILFEKVLMFTRPRIPSYEFVQAVWLDQVTLGPPTECKRTFKVEERLHKKELVYELRSESVMQRNLWVEKIVGVLHDRALAIKRKVSSGRV